MEKKIFAAPNLIGKEWMLITAKKPSGEVNTMTASWGTLGHLWGKDVAIIFVRDHRYTYEFVEASENFTLSFFDSKYKKELGVLGTVSGRDENKIKNVGFNIIDINNNPGFKEATTNVICKKLYRTKIEEACFIDKSIIDKCYPIRDYHYVYVGEILEIKQGE